MTAAALQGHSPESACLGDGHLLVHRGAQKLQRITCTSNPFGQSTCFESLRCSSKAVAKEEIRLWCWS